MPAAIKIPTTFTAVDKFSSVISKMTKGIKRFSTTSTSAIKRFDSRMTRSFKKLGKLSQLALGVGLGAVFLKAINNNIAYEDSLASVSSITGSIGEDLVMLEKMSKKTAAAQSLLGKDVLKAYELIGSAKPELLENTKLLDQVTNSAITLSKAGRMELAPAAEALTTTLNQFGLAGSHAGKVIDNLAAGAKFGSSSIIRTSEALEKFGTIAAATGTKVDESIALIQLVSPFEKGAEAGTKLRNVLGKMAGAKILPDKALKILSKAGVNLDIVTNSALPLGVRLKEMAKVGKSATDVMQIFGTENAALAQGIFSSIGKYDGMLSKVNQVGVAQDQANTNTNTLRFAIDKIGISYLNMTTATQSGNSSLQVMKNVLLFVSENMATVLVVAGSVAAAFVLMKAIVIGTTIATTAYSVALKINTAITNSNKLAMAGNAIAQGAYTIAMGIGTVATWLGTAAMSAFAIAVNLVTWPLLLVVAAIAAVVLIIMNWSKITAWFGKMWGKFTDFIGEAWGNVVKWFTEFDFVGMFKSIGQAILSFMLFPLKTVLRLLANIPGKVGQMAQAGLDKIGEFTGEVKVDSATASEVLPSTAQASSELIQKSVSKSNLDININDKGQNVESFKQTSGPEMPVRVSHTAGAF